MQVCDERSAFVFHVLFILLGHSARRNDWGFCVNVQSWTQATDTSSIGLHQNSDFLKLCCYHVQFISREMPQNPIQRCPVQFLLEPRD
jgi:hypothetical protein